MGRDDAHYQPTVDTWSEKDQRIEIQTPPGLMADLTMHAKVDGSPGLIWSILTAEHPETIFRGIKAITYREVLEDDGRGRRRLKVGHRNYVKVLFVQVAFDTDLIVEEHRATGEIHFWNASESFMKFFDGRWTVQPFNQRTLDAVFGEEQPTAAPPAAGQPWWAASGNLLARLTSSAAPAPEPESCLVTLEQKILPKQVPPPGIRNIVTRLSAGTLRHMMEDLRREVAKRQQGTHGGPPLATLSVRSTRPADVSALEAASARPAAAGSPAQHASISCAALQQLHSLDSWMLPLTLVIKL